jgi:hypothetical protein
MKLKLFMLLLGCKPEGRLTEQHDIFFGIAHSLKELVTEIQQFWPEAKGKIHIDVWREVTNVDGHKVEVVSRDTSKILGEHQKKLFFLNLGGYKPNDFEEYHYKMLALALNKTEAINKAKHTAFYRHTGFEGAPSHIDDKYGIDVDDIYEIEDVLPVHMKTLFRIQIVGKEEKEDSINAGYLPIIKIQ